MPWFKVDDKLHNHRKARLAGVAAMGLWALSGSWVAANLTDGFVPESVCPQWASNYRKLGASLVAAGLWSVAEKDGEKGWQFHDWNDFQPSAAKVRKDRREAVERMQRLRVVENVQ
jgi:hypothetical protein